MTLTIELPDNLEAALRALGQRPGRFRGRLGSPVLERDLATPAHTPLTRSQLAGERIPELRKGNFLARRFDKGAYRGRP